MLRCSSYKGRHLLKLSVDLEKVETSVVKAKCDEYRIPLYITENANHSLEVIDTLRNIEIIKSTMETFEKQMFK